MPSSTFLDISSAPPAKSRPNLLKSTLTDPSDATDKQAAPCSISSYALFASVTNLFAPNLIGTPLTSAICPISVIIL